MVEVLEYIVNDTARLMLRKLAEGAPEALGHGSVLRRSVEFVQTAGPPSQGGACTTCRNGC